MPSSGDLPEVGLSYVDWISVAQNRVWMMRAVVSAATNLLVL
jgi:hypothetical protein